MAKSLKQLFSCIALFPHFQMNLSTWGKYRHILKVTFYPVNVSQKPTVSSIAIRKFKKSYYELRPDPIDLFD